MVRRRLKILVLLLTLPFLAVIGRLWSIQGDVSSYVKYVLKDLEQNTVKIAVAPRRATIYDRHGELLAVSRAEFRLDFVYHGLKPGVRRKGIRAIYEEISPYQKDFPSREEIFHYMERAVDLSMILDPARPDEPDLLPLVESVPEEAVPDLRRRLRRGRAFEVVRPGKGQAHEVHFRPREAFRFELTLLRLARLLGPEVTYRDLERNIAEELVKVEKRVAAYVRWYRAQSDRTEGRVRMTERSARANELLRALPLYSNVDIDGITTIQYHPDDYRGILVTDSSRRFYPHGELTGPLVGYLRELDDKDLEHLKSSGRLLRLSASESLEYFYLVREGTLGRGDLMGATGLEARYDTRLRGLYGVRLVQKDSRGRLGDDLKRLPEVPGDDLITTLDIRLQSLLQEALRERCRPAGVCKAGSVVVMELPSGAIRAAVGFPSFDANRYRDSEYREVRQRIWGEAGWEIDRPLVQAIFPGSIFKVVTAVAALEEGRDWRGPPGPHRMFPCHGQYRYSRWAHCHSDVGHGGRHELDLLDAFQFSCNNYFYYLAHKHLEAQQLHDWAQRLGFGRYPGIDLAAGIATSRYASGSLKDPRRDPRAVRGARICQYAIGQTHVTATPLQVVRCFGALALRGRYLPTPYLVEPSDPEALPPIRESTIDAIWEGMRRAASEPSGTAGKHGLTRFRVATKTGTAQFQVQKKIYHAWLAGFGPLPEPRIAFAINLEESPESGGKACAPIALLLLDYLMREYPELAY